MNSMIRRATVNDLPEIKQLFTATIISVCNNDYDEEQRRVWCMTAQNDQRWIDAVTAQYFIIAEKENSILGFASLNKGNYIDFMYVHKDYQRQGVANRMLAGLEAQATNQKALMILSDISKTARPFFEKKGYVVVKEQENVREVLSL